jgi:hypothetical protein
VQKRTTLDKIEIDRDGVIGLRFAKEIVDDDGTILSTEWHRTAVPPGTDLAAHLAVVNTHLVEGLKQAPIQQKDTDKASAVAGVTWTRSVKDAYEAKLEASRARTIETPIEPAPEVLIEERNP